MREAWNCGSARQNTTCTCPRCTAHIELYDGATYLPCRCCGTHLIVERQRDELALRAVGDDKPAAELSVAGLNSELAELTHESSRIRGPKVLAEVSGGSCALTFGYFAISALRAHDLEMGLALLICAGVSAWFAYFVIRDTNSGSGKIDQITKNIQRQLAENQRIDTQAVRAAELGVDRLAFDLFLGAIMYYPAWIQESRASVPAGIAQAVKIGPDVVKLKMDGSEYLFTLNREQVKDGQRGKLEVCVNNILVLSVTAKLEPGQWNRHSSSHYANTFIEGQWVGALWALAMESKKCEYDISGATNEALA